MKIFLIRIAYWLGIAADALWAVLLLFPPLFGQLTGRPDFNPDLQTRLLMGIGGILMLGWTVILLWAVRKPIERRVVILVTAFPVVFGMFIISLIGYLQLGADNVWVMVKTIILFLSMVTSYVLARKLNNADQKGNPNLLT